MRHYVDAVAAMTDSSEESLNNVIGKKATVAASQHYKAMSQDSGAEDC